MENSVPVSMLLAWLLATVVFQSIVDMFFTRDILPVLRARDRLLTFLAVNSGALLVTGLVLRLTLIPQQNWLLAMRERGSMAGAVLLIVAEYFFWAAPFIALRGWALWEWRMKGHGTVTAEPSREKWHDFWGYIFVGSIVTVFLCGFVYVAELIVVPLMEGVEAVSGS